MTKEIHAINTRALDFVVELIEYIFEYPDDDYMTMECLCRKLVKHGLLDKADGHYQTHDICTDTHECVKDTHDKTENSSEKPNNSDTISRQAAISAICNACGKIDCDKMDKCEKLQLPPANSSEKPNNCEDCKWWFGYCHLEECDYEPTSSKMEQVDKDINVRSTDESQTEREGE